LYILICVIAVIRKNKNWKIYEFWTSELPQFCWNQNLFKLFISCCQNWRQRLFILSLFRIEWKLFIDWTNWKIERNIHLCFEIVLFTIQHFKHI
jgi:hypothetical protein